MKKKQELVGFCLCKHTHTHKQTIYDNITWTTTRYEKYKKTTKKIVLSQTVTVTLLQLFHLLRLPVLMSIIFAIAISNITELLQSLLCIYHWSQSSSFRFFSILLPMILALLVVFYKDGIHFNHTIYRDAFFQQYI